MEFGLRSQIAPPLGRKVGAKSVRDPGDGRVRSRLAVEVPDPAGAATPGSRNVTRSSAATATVSAGAPERWIVRMESRVDSSAWAAAATSTNQATPRRTLVRERFLGPLLSLRTSRI